MFYLCLLGVIGAGRLAAQQQPAEKPTPPPGPRTSASREPFSIEVFYWPISAKPVLQEGETSTSTNSAELVIPRKTRSAGGVALNLPGGLHNKLRMSFFQTKGSADTTAGGDLVFFSQGYSAGDYLATGYTLRNVKVSFDYLSYPAPPEGARFRLRTLWEGQATWVRATVDAPFKTNEAGAPVAAASDGTLWFAYPTFGVGVQHVASDRFRWEAKGSGFAFPGRSTIWDAEIGGSYNFGKFEAVFGARAFHFKTSPKVEQLIKGTIWGPYAGLRWIP
jgi:hypothetical protein